MQIGFRFSGDLFEQLYKMTDDRGRALWREATPVVNQPQNQFSANGYQKRNRISGMRAERLRRFNAKTQSRRLLLGRFMGIVFKNENAFIKWRGARQLAPLVHLPGRAILKAPQL